jgi:protein gp37
MASNSSIEWTDHTFNPWWGCVKVSPACAHCYAETFARRVGQDVWGLHAERRFFGEAHWAEPLRWNRQLQRESGRRRVFCASMADVFEDNPSVAGTRARLWDLIRETPNLDWQLLTKRPANISRMLPSDWGSGYINVWLGTTVENQKYAEERIPHLLGVPARIRFLSCEPLLGPLNLSRWFYIRATRGVRRRGTLHWVIAGGESGRSARPMEREWLVGLHEQCEKAGVAFFFKQWGGFNRKQAGRELDGRTWDELPYGGLTTSL